MRRILTIATVMALAGTAYAVSTGGEKTADASGKTGASCGAGEKTASAEGGSACCRKGAAAATKTAACKPAHDQEVTLTGKVLCEHCDLHTASACSPALKADGRKDALKICSSSKDVPELKKAGEVEVKGYVHPGPEGREEIEVVSFQKKPAKVS